jgi:hypothetical protein
MGISSRNVYISLHALGLLMKIGRQVASSIVVETVKNPLVVLQQGDRFLYLSEKAAVVLNQHGKVVTTYGADLFDDTIRFILQNR